MPKTYFETKYKNKRESVWMKKAETFFRNNSERDFFRTTVYIAELNELRGAVLVVGATTQVRRPGMDLTIIVPDGKPIACIVRRPKPEEGFRCPQVFLLDNVDPSSLPEEENSWEQEKIYSDMWDGMAYAHVLGMSFYDFVLAMPSMGLVKS